jgi:hypothetical protein
MLWAQIGRHFQRNPDEKKLKIDFYNKVKQFVGIEFKMHTIKKI